MEEPPGPPWCHVAADGGGAGAGWSACMGLRWRGAGRRARAMAGWRRTNGVLGRVGLRLVELVVDLERVVVAEEKGAGHGEEARVGLEGPLLGEAGEAGDEVRVGSRVAERRGGEEREDRVDERVAARLQQRRREQRAEQRGAAEAGEEEGVHRGALRARHNTREPTGERPCEQSGMIVGPREAT